MGDLLGQTELLLTRKEEADRPGAGVGGGAAPRVVVHLSGGFRGQCAGAFLPQPGPDLCFWTQQPRVELPLMLVACPLGTRPLSSVISPSPHHTMGRSEP